MAHGAGSKFATYMFEPEVFRKQIYCIEESACDTVETFQRLAQWFGVPCTDSAPGELCPFAPLVTPLVFFLPWCLLTAICFVQCGATILIVLDVGVTFLSLRCCCCARFFYMCGCSPTCCNIWARYFRKVVENAFGESSVLWQNSLLWAQYVFAHFEALHNVYGWELFSHRENGWSFEQH